MIDHTDWTPHDWATFLFINPPVRRNSIRKRIPEDMIPSVKEEFELLSERLAEIEAFEAAEGTDRYAVKVKV